MQKAYPGFRAEARMFVQTFYSLPGVHLQFVYFCARFLRYIPDPEKLEYRIPLGHDVPEPDEDALDAAVRGLGAEEAEAALREAKERGMLAEAGLAERAGDPLESIDAITKHRPGHEAAEFKLTLVSRHYKRLVDEHIIQPPPTTMAPEPSLPTVTEPWEWGDNPRAIDWTATLVAHGSARPGEPAAARARPEEPSPSARSFPAVEIYLDTSGSMPDPATALNVDDAGGADPGGIGAPEAGHRARDRLLLGQAARLGLDVRRGAGAPLPAPLRRRRDRVSRSSVLKASARERSDVDPRDRLGLGLPLQRAEPRERWTRCASAPTSRRWSSHSSRCPTPTRARQMLAPALASPRFRLVPVTSLKDFGRAAADLADALFGKG